MREWIRQYRPAILTLVVSSLIAACNQQPAAQSAPLQAAPPPCKLSVGWDPWEPYQYADTDGEIRGLDIEILELLAADAGCDVHYVRGEWGGLLAQLRDGSVDVLLAGTVLPEREAYAWFSAPYREETFSVFVRGDDLAELRDLTIPEMAAAGKKVGITEGYFYGEDINELAYASERASAFVPAPFAELNYWRLLDGTTDALLDDPFVGASVIRRKGWENRIVRHPQVLRSGSVSVMFSKASVDQAVFNRVNEALARRKADGQISAILARYQG